MKENERRERTKQQILIKQTTNQKRETCKCYKQVTTQETTAVRCYQLKVQSVFYIQILITGITITEIKNGY